MDQFSALKAFCRAVPKVRAFVGFASEVYRASEWT